MQRRLLGLLLMPRVLQLPQGAAAKRQQQQAGNQQQEQLRPLQQAANQMKQSCVQSCSSVHSSSKQQGGVLPPLLVRADHWQKLQSPLHGGLCCGQGGRPLLLLGSSSSNRGPHSNGSNSGSRLLQEGSETAQQAGRLQMQAGVLHKPVMGLREDGAQHQLSSSSSSALKLS
jgi:hypothetical protein